MGKKQAQGGSSLPEFPDNFSISSSSIGDSEEGISSFSHTSNEHSTNVDGEDEISSSSHTSNEHSTNDEIIMENETSWSPFENRQFLWDQSKWGVFQYHDKEALMDVQSCASDESSWVHGPT